MAQTMKHDDGSKMLVMQSGYHNPAFYVPSLKRVVFGCESWWGHIDGPDALKQITDEVIDGVWYVQALKSLSEKTTSDQ